MSNFAAPKQLENSPADSLRHTTMITPRCGGLAFYSESRNQTQ